MRCDHGQVTRSRFASCLVRSVYGETRRNAAESEAARLIIVARREGVAGLLACAQEIDGHTEMQEWRGGERNGGWLGGRDKTLPCACDGGVLTFQAKPADIINLRLVTRLDA